MKIKFICDNCKEPLKELIEEGNSIFVINDTIGGLSVIDHNNCLNHIVLCEECDEIHTDQLKENECYMDLDLMNNLDYKKDFYENLEELQEYIKKRGN